MSVPSDPRDASRSTGIEAITEAANLAREHLHAEIERTRAGIEELLVEERSTGNEGLRDELEALREETRRYVKRRVSKSEDRLGQAIRGIDDRTRMLEQRLDAFEREREYAEWRIHKNTEAMLDGLLREIRHTADLLTR